MDGEGDFYSFEKRKRSEKIQHGNATLFVFWKTQKKMVVVPDDWLSLVAESHPLIRLGLLTLFFHFLFRVFSQVQTPAFLDETRYLRRIGQHKKKQVGYLDRPALAPSSRRKIRGRSSSPKVKASSSSSLPWILVTGSSGRIGSAVVRALLDSGKYSVRGVDLLPPRPHRHCPGAEYVELDLVESSDGEVLSQALSGVVGVVHCAGLVVLHPWLESELHNGLTFLTCRLLALARECGSVRAFVHSSTVFVVNNGTRNLNAIPPTAPILESFSTSWGRIHAHVERMVIEAGDVDPVQGSFFTCVNRFPGLYGLNDDLFVTILVDHELSLFPTRCDVRSELLYLKNAAHAHYCALEALLSQDPKRALHSVNIITQSVAGETGTNLEFWQRARRALGGKRSFVLIPTACFYLASLALHVVQVVFWGTVFPHHVLFNFSWPVLDHLMHDNTYLGQVEALHAIGYRPLFNTESSFEDMARERLEARAPAPNKALLLPEDPRQDIDWEPREMTSSSFVVLHSVFLALVGPGPSWHEVGLMWLCVVTSLGFALGLSTRQGYSAVETAFCVYFAMWHLTGCVVAIGPSSKRWVHLGGRLGMYMFGMICADMTLTVILFGLIFASMEWTLVAGVGLALGLLLIVCVVPLRHQRSYAVICLLIMLGAQFGGLVPPVKRGMEWALPVLAIKFFICHGPRHEPYV